VLSDSVWQITFDRLSVTLFGGRFKVVDKSFPTTQVRVWQVVYLDRTLRIMRARKPESEKSSIFILKREEEK